MEPELTGVSFTGGEAAVVRTRVVGGTMVEKGMVQRERDASRVIISIAKMHYDVRK
jgi:hypothetical protein